MKSLLRLFKGGQPLGTERLQNALSFNGNMVLIFCVFNFHAKSMRQTDLHKEPKMSLLLLMRHSMLATVKVSILKRKEFNDFILQSQKEGYE